MIVTNTFYTRFDHECLRDEANRERATEGRSSFQQDRDRITFSSAFRRLQSKTQVFQAGEYDFYRTRLTHSLEVGNIARSICHHLVREGPLREDFQLDTDLVEAACLAHDLGHPPFGHNGERALHRFMEPYGGFEGNAQSLRILTRTIYSAGAARAGMSPSRALLDAILKYKRVFRERGADSNHFIYDDQEEFLRFSAGDAPREAVDRLHSVECQIMDLADDIAYSCGDVVDGVKARFITVERLRAWGEGKDLSTALHTALDQLCERIRGDRLEPHMARLRGLFIHACSLEPRESPLEAVTRRYSFTLRLPEESRAEIKLYKEIGSSLVFGSPGLHQIEYKGGEILRKMLDVLRAHYLDQPKPVQFLPGSVHRAIVGRGEKADKARALCDYISGMTDSFAIKTYKRLFDPEYGSITELI